MGTLSSRGDILSCVCGLAVRYDEYGALSPALRDGESAGGEKVFTTVSDWWFWQHTAVERIVVAAGTEPVCADEGESLFEVQAGSGLRFLERGRLSLGREGLCCGETRFPLEDIPELAVTGQRTLVFTARGGRYELRNDKPRSAAKYQRVFELLIRDARNTEGFPVTADRLQQAGREDR
jgi:hypothetical protein